MQALKFLLVFVFLGVCPVRSEEGCVLDGALEKKIAENTFKLVPIRQALIEYSPEQTADYVEKLCARSNLPVSERMNCEIMRKCEGQSCAPIFGPHGTAFLLDNGSTLQSAWHVVYSSHEVALNFLGQFLQSLSPERLKSVYAGMGPSFVLLNQQDEIVYDTRHPEIYGDTRYVSFGNPLTPQFHASGKKGESSYGYFENILEDHVQIKLGKNLGHGLSRASLNTPEDCYFGAGFVYDGQVEAYQLFSGKREKLTNLKKKTKIFLDFSLAPLPLSQRELEALPPEDLLCRMGYSKESAEKQKKLYSEEVLRQAIHKIFLEQQRHMRDLVTESHPRALFLSLPVLNGQSGGPLLNPQGEVVGILTNGMFVEKVSLGAGALRIDAVTKN